MHDWKRTLGRLHADEAGLKTLEVVAILAVAAIALTAIKFFWYKIFNFFMVESADTENNWSGSSAG